MGKKIFLIMAGVVMAAVLLLAACDYKQPGAAGGKEPKAQGQQSDQTTSQDQEMKVECGSDADCGKEIVGEPSCFQGNILIPRKMPRCDYPGTINSNCRMASEDKVILCSGSEFCRDGECLEISKQPCKDTDGGKTYNISGEVTDGFMELASYPMSRSLLRRYRSRLERSLKNEVILAKDRLLDMHRSFIYRNNKNHKK